MIAVPSQVACTQARHYQDCENYSDNRVPHPPSKLVEVGDF
jgi:hypothetical protein